MATRPSVRYPGQIDTTDPTGYPDGAAQDESALGAGDGTPLQKDWVNDFFGFVQALLEDVKITANNVAEKVGASQLLEALNFKLGGATQHTFVDLANGFYDGRVFNIQRENNRGPHMHPNGDSFYLCDGNTVYQYDLPVRNDLMSLTSTTPTATFSVVAQTTTAQGIDFNDDGTSLYVLGTDEVVYQYTLSTPYLVSSAVYATKSLNVGTEVTAGWDIHWTDGGTKLYVSDSGTNDGIRRYDATTPYDVSTASYATGQYLDTSGGGGGFPTMVNVTEDGLIAYVGNSTDIFQWDLSTAFDLTTAVLNAASYNHGLGVSATCLSKTRATAYTVDTAPFQPTTQHYIGRTVAW